MKRPIHTLAGLLILSLAAPLSADPPATTQPDAASLLNTGNFWVEALEDPDPAMRAKAASQLGRAGNVDAIKPLAALLQRHYVAHGRMRIAEADQPPAGPGPTTQPQEYPSAAFHAAAITSQAFIDELLSHPRADSWLWVKQQGGNPDALPGRLAESLSARTVAGLPAFDVNLAGAGAESTTEMLNLLMAIYQRFSETRFKQRVRRIELDGELQQAQWQAQQTAAQLKTFRDANHVAEVKADYDRAMAEARPFVERYERLVQELKAADRAAVAVNKDIDEAEDTREELRRRSDRVKGELDYLRSHPTMPRETWERKVNDKEREYVYYQKLLLKADRKLDSLYDIRRQAERRVNAIVIERDKLKRRIDEILGDIGPKWQGLAEQVAALSAIAQKAADRETELSAESAKLPSLSEVQDATSYGVVLKRASGGELVEQPKAVRLAAVRALAEIGDRRAVPALIRMLGDGDRELQLNAAVALSKITGQDLGTDPAKWQAWLDGRPK